VTVSLSTTWISAPGNACAAVFAALIVPDKLLMIVRHTIARPASTCGPGTASSNIAGVGCAVVGSARRPASLTVELLTGEVDVVRGTACRRS